MNYPKSKIITPIVAPDNTVLFDDSDLIPVHYNVHFAIRADAEFKGKAVYLDEEYDWQIVVDTEGFICAVPTKK